ncbi:cation diffusion facilitator family transporter [[Clostridium] fimetarium]|uniref:Cation diffusion facilitator family transporter n=1 Tax=[Clostridium] fimetarium TaxID=99656 RepID=A0A1I0RMZ6_9FIRM|nr:cation diffusion facilitator family transporter [[Clostridium] fimetarium]SEW42368.1 cation diffusion facilitator family transporter [[Clostridium] fimetarium]
MNQIMSQREKQIIKTSFIGVGTNILLTIFKAVIGIASNSVAILLDAVNNLSDALSSVLTIIGTKLASKPANKKHPYGYGRIEYITAISVAVIVLTAGISSFISSWKRIFDFQKVSYSSITMIIVVVAVIAKFILGNYFKKVGERVNSKALLASGADASFDALISITTLLSIIISIIWKVTLDGYIGLIIAMVIIKAGIEMVIESFNEILGQRPDGTLTKSIKEDIRNYDGIKGAYDLILNSYGPVNMIGSIHIEVDENTSAKQIYILTRRIQTYIMEKYGIFLTVGIYIVNSDEKTLAIADDIKKIVMSYNKFLEIHALYIAEDRKLITFDVVIDLSADKEEEKSVDIEKELQKKYSDYTFLIRYDTDFSD